MGIEREIENILFDWCHEAGLTVTGYD